jgi:acetyl esterase/lipase
LRAPAEIVAGDDIAARTRRLKPAGSREGVRDEAADPGGVRGAVERRTRTGSPTAAAGAIRWRDFGSPAVLRSAEPSILEVHMRCALRLGHALVASVCLTGALAASAQAQTVQGIPDVTYGRAEGIALKLDVYRPLDARGLPAVIVIHGGGWRTGDKRDWAREGRRLAARGFVAFVINYRLACTDPGNPLCGFHHPAQPDDVRLAYRWVRAHGREHGANPKRIGALGGSAGGHLSMLIGTTRKGGTGKLGAVVSWSGPTRVLAGIPGGAIENYIGCPSSVCPRRYADASPLLHVTPDDAPTYLANSRHEQVGLSAATTMAEALTRAGVPNQLRILEGSRHSKAYANDVWDESVAFLHRYLG